MDQVNDTAATGPDLEQQPDNERGATRAGLDDLAREAIELESGPGNARAEREAQQAQQAQQTEAAALLATLELCRSLAAPVFAWWPEFGDVWSNRQLDGIASSGAAVMQRQGWTMGEAMERWGPYIALIVATAGPGFATYQAVQSRREQLERAERANARPGVNPGNRPPGQQNQPGQNPPQQSHQAGPNEGIRL